MKNLLGPWQKRGLISFGLGFVVFVAALALAEVPYALGAVYLGTSFLERRIVPLLALGIAGVLLSLWAIRRLHHRPELQP